MDFAPGEASLSLQRLARDFARQEIAPHTDALDQEKTRKTVFPEKFWTKATPWACAPPPYLKAAAGAASIC